MFKLRYCCVYLCLWLAGCVSHPSTPSPPSDANIHLQHLQRLAPISSFDIKGRLGVNSHGKGFSGSISWAHQPDSDLIDIFTPLGSKVASIHKTSQTVVLTTQDGHTLQAQDAESLTEMALGMRLPVSGLSDWVLGRPTKANIDASTWDDTGRLTSLQQQGWQIDYPVYDALQSPTLPSKILLRNEKLNLKLLIESWKSTSTSN